MDYPSLLILVNKLVNKVDEMSALLVNLQVEHNDLKSALDLARDAANITISNLEQLEVDFNELSGWKETL